MNQQSNRRPQPLVPARRQQGPAAPQAPRAEVVYPHVLDAMDQFVGRVVHAGRVEIWGLFNGHLRALEVSIKQGGKVTGTVEANLIRNDGTLSGTIRAQRLELSKRSRLEGDVKVAEFGTEPGCKVGPNTTWHTPGRNMIPILTPEELAEEIGRAESNRRGAPRTVQSRPQAQLEPPPAAASADSQRPYLVRP